MFQSWSFCRLPSDVKRFSPEAIIETVTVHGNPLTQPLMPKRYDVILDNVHQTKKRHIRNSLFADAQMI